MIARAVLAVVALAAALVVAADLRTTHDVHRAVAEAGRDPSAATVKQAAAELRSVASRTSDTAPLLREAELELGVSDFRAALPAALTAARREPENARAWLLVGYGARGAHDDHAAAEARDEIARLVAGP